MKKIVKNIQDAVKHYINKRIEIAKDTARAVESRIRTGEPVLGELSLFVGGLSTQFGEKTKRDRIKLIRETLSKAFPRYDEFSKRRIIK